MCRRELAAYVVGISLFALTPRAALAAETYWTGQSAGFAVEWSDEDLSARAVARGETIFSARANAVKQVTTPNAPQQQPQTVPCRFRQQLRLLSLVGPYLGFEERNYSSCDGWAHPAEESRYRSVDLRRRASSQQPSNDAADVSLTEFFSADDISKALRADPLVRRSVDGELPHELPELLAQLTLQAHPPEGMCFSIPGDLPGRFVFYDLQDGRVSVRLSLPGLGPCRAKLTELVLLLPFRPEHKAMLVAAKKRESGILMIDAARLFGRYRTTIAVDYREAP